MASKALTWSVSSASLVSSSSSSSSGVKALCFAPRSLSFPAKKIKISPWVGVVRAQNNEYSQSDYESDYNQLWNRLFDRIANDRLEKLLQLMAEEEEEEFETSVDTPEEKASYLRLLRNYHGGPVQSSSGQNQLILDMESEASDDQHLIDDSEFAEERSTVQEPVEPPSAADRTRVLLDLYDSLRSERPKRWLDSTTRWCNSTTRWYDSTTEEEFVIYYTMPGMDASELEVTILGEKLNITFKEPEGEGADMKRALIWLYKTRIPLPPRCEREKAKAQFYNQILTVRMPRTAIDSTVPIYVPVKGD